MRMEVRSTWIDRSLMMSSWSCDKRRCLTGENSGLKLRECLIRILAIRLNDRRLERSRNCYLRMGPYSTLIKFNLRRTHLKFLNFEIIKCSKLREHLIDKELVMRMIRAGVSIKG